MPLSGTLASLKMLKGSALEGCSMSSGLPADVESMPPTPGGDSRGWVKSSVSDELRMRTFWA